MNKNRNSKSKLRLHGSTTSAISLPHVVLDKIFGFMNFNDLKSIRLSCTTWNEVSTPYFVNKARVPIEFEGKKKPGQEVQRISILELGEIKLNDLVVDGSLTDRNLKNFYDTFENVDEIIHFESYRLQGNEFLRIPRFILLLKTRGELIRDLQIQFLPKFECLDSSSLFNSNSVLELSWLIDLNNALFEYMPNITNLIVDLYFYSYTRCEANVEMDQMIRFRQLDHLEKFYLIMHDDNDILENSRQYAIEKSILKQISANIISSSQQMKKLKVSNQICLDLLKQLPPVKSARLTKLIVKMNNEHELEPRVYERKESFMATLLKKELHLKSVTIICENLRGINIDSLYTFLQSQSSSLLKLKILEEGRRHNPPGHKCTLPILPKMHKLEELKLFLCADTFRFSNSDWIERAPNLKILTLKYTTGDPELWKSTPSQIDPFTNFLLGTKPMESGKLEDINILACDYGRNAKLSFQTCIEYLELAKKKFPSLKALKLMDVPRNNEFYCTTGKVCTDMT